MIFRSKIKWVALGGFILSILSLAVHLILARYSSADILRYTHVHIFTDDLGFSVAQSPVVGYKRLWRNVRRGHQNSLEYMPEYFILLILGGMRHPCVSAGVGFLYLVTRYFYFTGYSSGDPQKRLSIGKYGYGALLGLMVCTISFGLLLIIA